MKVFKACSIFFVCFIIFLIVCYQILMCILSYFTVDVETDIYKFYPKGSSIQEVMKPGLGQRQFYITEDYIITTLDLYSFQPIDFRTSFYLLFYDKKTLKLNTASYLGVESIDSICQKTIYGHFISIEQQKSKTRKLYTLPDTYQLSLSLDTVRPQKYKSSSYLDTVRVRKIDDNIQLELYEINGGIKQYWLNEVMFNYYSSNLNSLDPQGYIEVVDTRGNIYRTFSIYNGNTMNNIYKEIIDLLK